MMISHLIPFSSEQKEKKIANRLKGKTILLTGATYGIGEALSRYLFRYEVKLILIARTSEKLAELQQEAKSYRAEVITYTCNLYDEESINELCEGLKNWSIDFFISNAGKSIMRSLTASENRLHDFKRTMAVNYLAPVQLLLNLLDQFKNSKTHIINVSTYNVLMKSPPNWSAYVSSKKAMYSWFQSNDAELRLAHISVSHIFLPLVESRMKEANIHYATTPAMPMNIAVSKIIKALLNRNYTYKPWWHMPFQIVLFVVNPFWNLLWRNLLKNKWY